MKKIILISILLIGLLNNSMHSEDPKPEIKFKPNPKLKDLADNTVMDLGKFEWEKPVGEPHTGQVTDYSGMTYDMHNHRILLFGGGHSATWTDAIYSFDFESLKFIALYTPTPYSEYKIENVDRAFFLKGTVGNYPRPIGRHTYDLLVVPDDRKEFWMMRTGTGPSAASVKGLGYTGGAIGKFDFKTATWELIDAKGVLFGGYGGVAEYDPESKTIIGVLGQSISSYDLDKKISTKILDNIQDIYKDSFGYSGSLVYFSPNKKMYLFGAKSKSVWSFETNQTDLKKSILSKIENSGDFPKIETSYVFDSKNKIIGGGISENKFYAFDPIKGTWESKLILGGEPKSITFHCIAYSPIDNVYIFIASGKIWAYRWKK